MGMCLRNNHRKISVIMVLKFVEVNLFLKLRVPVIRDHWWVLVITEACLRNSCMSDFKWNDLQIKARYFWDEQGDSKNLLTDLCDWFLGIPCEPPPRIANGHYTEAQSYAYQSTVTYTCDEVPKGADPFSLIGPATIYCTFDTDLNGVWSGPPPECRGCWDFFFICCFIIACVTPKIQDLSLYWKGVEWTRL